VYKLNGWYEFLAGTGQMLQHTLHSWCTLNDYTTTGGVKKVARYRWNFSPRSESWTANDYSALFGLIDAANAPVNELFAENLRGQADIDQWLRTFAIEHAVGNWDSFGNRNAQNMYAYKPSQDRWKLLIWDFNIVLGNSGSDGPSGDNLFQYNSADRVMRRIYQEPEFVRAYMRALQEIASGPMAGPAVERLVDARFAAFRASGLTATPPSAIKSWISSRRRYLQTVAARYNASFSMEQAPAPGTNQNWTTLRGTAPLNVACVAINGVTYDLQWETPTNWSVIVPLHSGPNTLAMQGLDNQGQPVVGTTASATVVFTGNELPLAGNLVINEILHHPEVPGSEYVELFNRSAGALDLTGLRLQGLDYDFLPGTVIMPGEFQLLVKSRLAFGSIYGFALPVSGEFPGQLSANGETLRIVRDPGPGLPAQIFDEVTFGSQSPWPVAAAEAGVSIQLSDASKDNSLSEYWTAVTRAQAASPEWKFVSVSGAASDGRLLVYHSPYEVPPDPLALEGRWVGTIDFQGQLYHMTVEFERLGSNRWSGLFIGEDITNPLGSIRFTFPTVSFAFADFPVPITFSGRMGTNGLTIDGTFSQPTPQGQMSAPFKLERDQAAQKFGGEVYIDDIKLVKGTDAAVGDNLVRNGDFEAPLTTAWNVGTNHTATVVSTETKHSGSASLKLVASFGGRDLDSSVWQETLPLSPDETYTLSYWYLPSANGKELTVRLADGQLASTHTMAPDRIATPGMPNVQRTLSVTNAPALPAVFINEWMAANSSSFADPADGAFEDWFELYNAEAHAVDLSGFTLTDSAANKAKWRIPDGTTIPAHGFLLVWADEDTGQNSPGTALHVNFKLSQSGESIGLFAPNGALMDWVTFGAQSTDISEGRGANGAPTLGSVLKPRREQATATAAPGCAYYNG
jgi:hypothetical protein